MGDTKNIIIAPHLNAEVYRKNTNVANDLSHLDYIRIHNDGTTLVGCSELTGRYWTGGAKIIKTVEDTENLEKLTISLASGTADGIFINNSDKALFCEDSGTVSVWTQGNNAWALWEEVITVTEHDDAVLAVDCLDPVNHYVTVGADGNIKIWDINEMICETNYLASHSMLITGVAVTPARTSFATCSMDRHVTLWDKNFKEKISDIAVLDCGARCVQWLDENRLLVGDESGVVSLVDLRSLQASVPLLTFPAPVHRITANPDKNKVAVCCDNRTLSVYEVSGDRSLDLVYKDSKHDNYIRGMAWHTTHVDKVYTAGWDGAVRAHSIL